jgi:hypothetical protein
MSSVRSSFGSGAASLERTRQGLDLPRPVGLRAMAAAYDREIVFDEPIVTDEPLGGHHTITIRRDGSWRYVGHMRATGFPSFEFSVLATLGATIEVPGAPAGAVQLAFSARGEVHGTNEPGDREHSWDQQGHSPMLAAGWESFRHATLQRHVQFDTDWFGPAGDVLSFVGQVVVMGSLFGPIGVAIVLVGEAADDLGFDSLVLPGTVGVLVSAGAAFVFGPAVLIPVFLVGAAVTAALVKQRHLSDEERAFADRVFAGRVPLDRVMLTNLVGLGGRPFTAPGPGGTILVNVGHGYDDPVRYTGNGGERLGVNAAGQLLIHELAHAWQIANDTFTPAYYCKALSTAIGTVGGDMSAYTYGPAGQSWGSFGTEQQASIVDEWFAGKLFPEQDGAPQRQRAFEPMSSDADGNAAPNPYFGYIRDNIRAGIV